jgi:uncharacterized protein YggU (UPF0235/DUF167 family)
MKMTVRVKPQSKKNEVIQVSIDEYSQKDGSYYGRKGRSSGDCLLADYFEVKKSQISLISGLKSKLKVIEIIGE